MGHLKGLSCRDSQPRVRMTTGRGVLEKSNRITWCSGWTPRFWKFSKKSFRAFLSWNRMWRRGMGSKEEEPEPWRGFQPRVDLCGLGAIAHFMWKREKRERERENTSQPKTKNRKEKKRYVCMNMWRAIFKSIIGKNPSQTYQHTIHNNQTHI